MSAPSTSSPPSTPSHSAGKACDQRDAPPLAVRTNGNPSRITPSATARPTVSCNAMAEIAAPSEAKIGACTRVRYSTMKCNSITAKVASTGSVSTASGTAMPRKATSGIQIRLRMAISTPSALGAEPGQPAEQILAALLRREPAAARQEGAPVLLDELHPAIGPAVALPLIGGEVARQQTPAIAVLRVMRAPSPLEQRQPEIGILDDGVARPAAGGDQAPRAGSGTSCRAPRWR